MGFSGFVAFTSLVMSAASAEEQHEDNKKMAQNARLQANALQDSANSQRRQLELQKQAADIENARQVRASIRQARIARASVINQGANSGTQFSSGVQGGASSVVAQNEANMDYFGNMSALKGRVLNEQMIQGADAAQVGQLGAANTVLQADSAEWGALGSLSSTIFNSTSESGNGFRTIFGFDKKKA